MVLICISLVTNEVKDHLCAYLPSVYLLWCGVCSHLLPICGGGCLFSYYRVLKVIFIIWIQVPYHTLYNL